MRLVRLFAIRIDEVRDIFGAEPALASRLRKNAAASFPPPKKQSRGLLDLLGPLTRHPASQRIAADLPLNSDVDALLAGGYLPPERLHAGWKLLLAWLTELSVAQSQLELADLDAVEFDLARCGLASEFSLRKLAERELGIPLRPLPEQLVGYTKELHVAETHSALTAVNSQELAEPTRQVLATLLPILATASQHQTDLVVVETPSQAG